MPLAGIKYKRCLTVRYCEKQTQVSAPPASSIKTFVVNNKQLTIDEIMDLMLEIGHDVICEADGRPVTWDELSAGKKYVTMRKDALVLQSGIRDSNFKSQRDFVSFDSKERFSSGFLILCTGLAVGSVLLGISSLLSVFFKVLVL